MSEHPSPRTNASDEIDLGQLLRIVKNGFKSLGNFGLRIFLFLKKNMYILLGLILFGVGVSFGLNQLFSKKLKSEVIVRPNFQSTDYLEDVVEEIKINFLTKNDAFFNSLEIRTEDAKGFEIAIEAILEEEVESDKKIMNQMRYLEALNNFKSEAFVIDILRSELAEKSVINYKLTFLYLDAKKGPELVEKVIKYINTNKYYNEIKEVYAKNAKARISNNTKLIEQIDDVVANYSNSLKPGRSMLSSQSMYVDKEPLNVPALINLKVKLNEVIEEKNLELNQQSNIVSILNYGKTQEVKKPFFNNRFFKFPMFLVLGFLTYCFIRYLNNKTKELS